MYRWVLEAEANAEQARHEANLQLLSARTLGYLLLDGVFATARSTVLSELAACHSKADALQSLYDLGHLYVRCLLSLFKSRKGPYTSPSDHPSRPSFDQVLERYKALLEHTPRDYSTARKQALLRDGFRCMVTRAVSVRHPQLWSESEGPLQGLECCHIFPEALGRYNVQDGASEEHSIATAWTMLDRFGCHSLLERLSGVNIHRLDNILTLTQSLYTLFDAMDLWFEPICGHANRYRVEVGLSYTHAQLAIPHEVQFTSHENLPLPNPEYLTIHAACCRIAHMSGAAEYANKVVCDLEDTRVLAEDGSSAELLIFSLGRLATVVPGPV
ncbi:hypothetical protein C2E23DRAFT_744329 [Lenzites betulinus]|nr:hypothetical protein C2E23DRAFT_744329 [Lenzites betulinus]